jgi:cob(I)alamin adenosyltransferase
VGNRLSRIYTRTGDDGTTGLAGGKRVPKFDLRIHACGDVDELNCALGLALAEPGLASELAMILTAVQHELFELGGELAMPEYRTIDAAAIARLEQHLDRLNEDLPPLKEFILPRGSRAVASCHLARAVCRRAERSLWTLAAAEPVRPELPQYLNRLADLLFVAARWLTAQADDTETQWDRSRRPRGEEPDGN